MKIKNLQMKKALRTVLFVLLLCAAGMTKAQTENITFADANVKAICVANWDTDGDGELNTTEAAAVTFVALPACSMPGDPPPPPRPFVADRPFLFLVRETRTGLILFLGRVVKP